MSHNKTAKSVREHKEANPHMYCPKCLWKTNGNYQLCPRHGGTLFQFDDRSLVPLEKLRAAGLDVDAVPERKGI